MEQIPPLTTSDVLGIIDLFDATTITLVNVDLEDSKIVKEQRSDGTLIVKGTSISMSAPHLESIRHDMIDFTIYWCSINSTSVWLKIGGDEGVRCDIDTEHRSVSIMGPIPETLYMKLFSYCITHAIHEVHWRKW